MVWVFFISTTETVLRREPNSDMTMAVYSNSGYPRHTVESASEDTLIRNSCQDALFAFQVMKSKAASFKIKSKQFKYVTIRF